MKVLMNKEIYLEWIRISTKCNQMRNIVQNDMDLKVEDIIEWKREYDILLDMMSKARFNTLNHITKCNTPQIDPITGREI